MTAAAAVRVERTGAAERDSLIARAALVLLFGAMAVINVRQGRILLAHWDTLDATHRYLPLAVQVSNTLFGLLVISVTCFRLGPVRKAPGLLPRLLAVGGTFASFPLVLLPGAALPPALTIFALAMTAGGILLSFAVLSWLGRSFSIMAEARRLVTRGPYAIVRHPLYICEEIAVLGTMILHFSPFACMVVALHCSLQFRRMVHEERVLRQAFPEYAAYAARVPRILPLPRPAGR